MLPTYLCWSLSVFVIACLKIPLMLEMFLSSFFSPFFFYHRVVVKKRFCMMWLLSEVEPASDRADSVFEWVTDLWIKIFFAQMIGKLGFSSNWVGLGVVICNICKMSSITAVYFHNMYNICTISLVNIAKVCSEWNTLVHYEFMYN